MCYIITIICRGTESLKRFKTNTDNFCGNKLYSNSSTQMNNLNDVVEAIFVVPDVSIVQPGSTEIFFYIISKLHRVLVVRRN